MRLAYADPPYPGKAYLYPENTEVDHVALIAQLQEYDGWALSTNEQSLQHVLSLCPPGLRVLAWCRPNTWPARPNPLYAWEPVIMHPVRTERVRARSYMEGFAPTGFLQSRRGFAGAKTEQFASWLFECLGADGEEDTLDDLFPGTGVIGATWSSWRSQLSLFNGGRPKSGAGAFNILRKTNEALPGLEDVSKREWTFQRDKPAG